MEEQEIKDYLKENARNKVNELVDLGARLRMTKEQVFLIFQEIVN